MFNKALIEKLRNCGNESGGCGYDDFLIFLQLVYEFIMSFGLILAAFGVVYIGYLFVTSKGNVGVVTHARNAFFALIIGMVLLFASYYLVGTILLNLGVDPNIINAALTK